MTGTDSWYKWFCQWLLRVNRYSRPLTGMVALALLVSVIPGCAPTKHGQLTAFLRAHEQTVSTGHYTVMPPDAVLIHAPIAPEIDGAIERVRPDGKVALRLLGEVDVAGLTTEQIAAKLSKLLARYYVAPEVVVNVASYASQCYYIFGEVASPGARQFSGRDTLLYALAQAQPTFLAWRSQIRIMRPDPESGERQTIIVDLDQMVQAGDLQKNILLQPGDIIHVPPTPLAWVGLRIRELLYPVQPLADAYNTPADFLDSTHAYEYEFNYDGDPWNRPRSRRSRR
ncbi:MAG: polysaccharide biosynthesis/export family protein [Planctomycetota bacterium]